MQVTLQRAEDNTKVVTHFLTACREKAERPMAYENPVPLPYAFYLLAFDHKRVEPAGMVEFFFYDQAFDCYHDCPYPQAFHLSRLAPMGHVVQVRNLIVDASENRAALIRLLVDSMTFIARALGARYLTASEGIDFAALRSLTRETGATQIDPVNDGEKELSLLALDWAPRSATPARQFGTMSDDLLLARTIRRRGWRDFATAPNAGPKLDKLLPAHWVGVWQRQLRDYAW